VEKARLVIKSFWVLATAFGFFTLGTSIAFATPTTLIWTPSTDIQPYKKIHLNVDNYTPVKGKDHNDTRLYVQRVYGPTFSLLSDKLWLCVDYQATQSSYGAINYGLAWKFTNNVSAILAYDIYNNHNLADTITFQLDVDF